MFGYGTDSAGKGGWSLGTEAREQLVSRGLSHRVTEGRLRLIIKGRLKGLGH